MPQKHQVPQQSPKQLKRLVVLNYSEHHKQHMVKPEMQCKVTEN